MIPQIIDHCFTWTNWIQRNDTTIENIRHISNINRMKSLSISWYQAMAANCDIRLRQLRYQSLPTFLFSLPLLSFPLAKNRDFQSIKSSWNAVQIKMMTFQTSTSPFVRKNFFGPDQAIFNLQNLPCNSIIMFDNSHKAQFSIAFNNRHALSCIKPQITYSLDHM